jgi:hypothetical protein
MNGRARYDSWCDWCGKRCYLTRKNAKVVARLHPTHYTTYQCPVDPQFWHVGRLARAIVQGVITRNEYYREEAS